MPFLHTNDGVRLHYVDHGPRDAPVLLLLPGWGTSTAWYDRQIEELSPRYRVISYDPRGQGRSERTDNGQRMERAGKDLDDVINALGLGEVALLGWSFGVSIVLSYIDVFGCAALSKAVLVCGGPRLINAEDWELGFVDVAQALDWIALQRNSMESAADFVLPQYFANPPTSAELARLREDITTMSATGSAAMCWSVLNQDYTDVLSKVRVPTLVLAGAQDTVIPAGNGPYLAESIPTARHSVFDNSAHCPFLEEPDEFNATLEEFLSPAGVGTEAS